MNNFKTYTTSEVIKKLSLTRNALRLYEKMGLFAKISRTQSGYRNYSQDDIIDLQFIIEAKKANFTLNEIKNLLSMNRKNNSVTCGKISLEIKSKVEEIDIEILNLHAKKKFLNRFLNVCKSQSSDKKCEIIKSGFNKKSCCP